jgi:hypothetical protein
VAGFIGYPRGRILAVFDTALAADTAVAAVRALGTTGTDGADMERFEGAADADRFDASGARHGPVARVLRAVQFSLMDQLPALAWYEAALRDGKVVLAFGVGDRAATQRLVAALRTAGGHFINRFGRLSTEELARWSGPEPSVSNLMKH